MDKLYGGGVCVCGEGKMKNGNKIICVAFRLVFHSLTLCAAVGASAIKVSSAAATLNWTLNFRQLAPKSLLLLHLILCSTKFLFAQQHQIFSFLLCSTKFSLVLSSTKFSFAFCLLLCTESSVLHSHTGITPGLEAQSNFVFWCVEHHIKNLWHRIPTIKFAKVMTAN